MMYLIFNNVLLFNLMSSFILLFLSSERKTIITAKTQIIYIFWSFTSEMLNCAFVSCCLVCFAGIYFVNISNSYS